MVSRELHRRLFPPAPWVGEAVVGDESSYGSPVPCSRVKHHLYLRIEVPLLGSSLKREG